MDPPIMGMGLMPPGSTFAGSTAGMRATTPETISIFLKGKIHRYDL
jgi:hypothetical protein